MFISRVIRWNCFSKIWRISLSPLLKNNDIQCWLKTAGWSQITAFRVHYICTMHCVQCMLEKHCKPFFLFFIKSFTCIAQHLQLANRFSEMISEWNPLSYENLFLLGLPMNIRLHISRLSQLLSYGTHFCWDWHPIVSSSKWSILHQVSRISKWSSYETQFCWDYQQYFYQVGRISQLLSYETHYCWDCQTIFASIKWYISLVAIWNPFLLGLPTDIYIK